MTTTPSAIRDRAITVVAALTPSSDSGVGFRAYRNEGGAEVPLFAQPLLAAPPAPESP